MPKIELRDSRGGVTDITTEAFAKSPRNEDFDIVIDGVYVGSFFLTKREGRPAIVFGADNKEIGEFQDPLDHPRGLGDEAGLFLPDELSELLP